MIARAIVLLAAAVGLAASTRAGAAVAAQAGVSGDAAGESIYLRGVTGSGAPLEGTRPGSSLTVKGADAACVNCHQRSGLGSEEGGITVPPVTGEYLLQSSTRLASQPVGFVDNMHGNRPAYTEATLARAIRAGIDSRGRPMASLMPRFSIDDADVHALVDYLKQLTVRQVPGVSETLLQFATVFTPDVDPAKRAGVLDVLEHYIVEKNRFPLPPSPRMWSSAKTAYAKSMYMANRHWQLHVWDLQGPPSGWHGQLQKFLHDQPVYALLSGAGASHWQPVDEFCQQQRIPCLFPNVDVPVAPDGDFYSLYFSRGVLLESALIGTQLLAAAPAHRPRAIEQIYRRGDSGEAAARALASQLEAAGIGVRDRPLPRSASSADLRELLAEHGVADTLVLWLRPHDVAALAGIAPGRRTVYLSGLMAGLEDAPVPAAWRPVTHVAYPFDLPDKRGIRLDYPLGWFALRHIPVVDLQAQADAYLACSILTETLKYMADNISREYLIEQMEDLLERRLITGYYPHLSLGTHQHFASRGGYIAHFAEASGTRLVADSDWLVP